MIFFVGKLCSDVVRIALWDLRPVLVEPVSFPVHFLRFELVLYQVVQLFLSFAVERAYLLIESIFLIGRLCHFINKTSN